LLFLAFPLVQPMGMNTVLRSCQKFHTVVKVGLLLEVLCTATDCLMGVVPATAVSAIFLLSMFWLLLSTPPGEP